MRKNDNILNTSITSMYSNQVAWFFFICIVSHWFYPYSHIQFLRVRECIFMAWNWWAGCWPYFTYVNWHWLQGVISTEYHVFILWLNFFNLCFMLNLVILLLLLLLHICLQLSFVCQRASDVVTCKCRWKYYWCPASSMCKNNTM